MAAMAPPQHPRMQMDQHLEQQATVDQLAMDFASPMTFHEDSESNGDSGASADS